MHHHFAQPSILDKHITMWYNIGIVEIYITLPPNLTFVRNDNKVVHRRVQMSDEYKQGYEDALNTTINITKYDKCAEYRNGYEDACKDTAVPDSNLTTVSFSF